MKITEKVSFNIASEASNVHILSGQKLIENAKNCRFWRFLKNLKFALKLSMGRKLMENAGIKNWNETFWMIFKECVATFQQKKSLKKAISSTILRLVFLQGFLSLLLWSKQVVKHSLHGWNIAPFHKGFQVFSLSTLRASIKAGKAMVGRYLHGVWKSEKKSHSTLRARQATFTFWVDKSSKMVHFGEFEKKSQQSTFF